MAWWSNGSETGGAETEQRLTTGQRGVETGQTVWWSNDVVVKWRGGQMVVKRGGAWTEQRLAVLSKELVRCGTG